MKFTLFLSLLIISLLTSCVTTRNSAFVKVDQLVNQKQYSKAAEILDTGSSKGESSYYGDKDQLLRYLDIGMLYHMGGQHKLSIDNLTKAEELMEEYYTKSISSAAASFLLNDYMLEYSGEPYEDLYLNVFKAVDYAKMNDFDNSFVEIKRLGDKLNLLEDKYKKVADSMNSSKDAKGSVKAGKNEFYNSALAHYISMLLYRADTKPDDADIDIKKINEAFKDEPTIYDFSTPDFSQYLDNSSKAKLNILSFVGRSPTKKANTFVISTQTNKINYYTAKETDSGQLQQNKSFSIIFPGIEDGYRFKCQTPYLVPHPSKVKTIKVTIDGQEVGQLQLLENIDNVVTHTFQLREPLIVTKTIIRTVVKGVVAQKAKKAVNDQASKAGTAGLVLGILAGVATDVAVDSSEQADLRSSRYLPSKAFIGEFDLNPGLHDIKVSYYDNAGNLVFVDTYNKVTVDKSGLNLLPSYDLD